MASRNSGAAGTPGFCRGARVRTPAGGKRRVPARGAWLHAPRGRHLRVARRVAPILLRAGFGARRPGERLSLPPAFEYLREQVEANLKPLPNPRETSRVS